ncbi:MAG: hypothetical protein HFG59_04305 [Lachnospiraceae bacterium]|nr:hypothetical protein [Lachnospiraceae bacterium]
MEGVNGIQAARALRDKKEEALLIFITGFKEYVFEAFDVAAFHYLLKPVEEKNLRRYLPKPWQRWRGKSEVGRSPFLSSQRAERFF